MIWNLVPSDLESLKHRATCSCVGVSTRPHINVQFFCLLSHFPRRLINRCRSPRTKSSSLFSYQLWGKSPETQSMSSSNSRKATGSKCDGTGRVTASTFLLGFMSLYRMMPQLVLGHSVAFLKVDCSMKARECEDMSILVARWSAQDWLFVAHKHSYTIVDSFGSLRLNGAYSRSAWDAYYFFQPPALRCRNGLFFPKAGEFLILCSG